MSKPLLLTELVLRDAHQSLLATRMRLEDMLPIAEKLDSIGYWSMESWGGATFDSCIRYLGEDPWERIRELKKAMPNTRQQMLLRGQNLLGYRHYADDVVKRFIERAKENGVDVFRIFDAMNDVRNLKTAIKVAKDVEGHAQGTLAYTVSPVHTLDKWVAMAQELEDLGCDSLFIKDMAGLLRPNDAYELVSALKKNTDLPIAMQCHATTGLSVATYQKAIDAGIDMLDTAISSMSMTYGHSPTETLVAMTENTDRDTGLSLPDLAEVASYFREVRKKYAKFEGSLKGVDARILLAQVPGGMLTNMEGQLKEQGALDKFDEVLEEIPKVREDLGFIPLVTPTSQIVGTQAVLNVLSGERYSNISKETAAVLKGEYGATAAEVNKELQKRVLDGEEAITCRPADLLDNELDALTKELKDKATDEDIRLADDVVDDVLTYALFPQIGLKFLKNRDNPDAFEPAPGEEPEEKAEAKEKEAPATTGSVEQYEVEVDGKRYNVKVGPTGKLDSVKSASSDEQSKSSETQSDASDESSSGEGETIKAPLAGNIFKVVAKEGATVKAGDVVLVLEAMKMETDIKAEKDGKVQSLHVKEGDAVTVGDALVTVG
ncbi:MULTISPECIES: sodium-extruding oxaloacetate decarboxylase subunit alpha [Idiomarina]|uniref:Sodium-extruding oxaloacetate decarboxylase subunit alpha n=1 Tax=Idiomarina abyssalis TaxID=86102 RepID=A0A8I1G4E7_9GAMM|nr:MULTISPECIES: sodium-extruding oxaloacetate decarboxylase subunit alpha [Idiomarina]MAO69306.1 oxaloacetate decarboxylase subunit alpha [Idiomarina sp.]MBF80620.1 oxaloacetate decarboxylase subunit alpha [Idiomarina sp.]MBJ7267193.1 sodium-extruding oxaloacetate decarboxylase subunit alpha [Idiomarina abyssalis]MBJ7273646.1 sodium-extruding oxaloacetate decarboxylase subunit alpha [Idiomarina abyssalis]MBJ7315534.1 sodium-extruding oxaloacetate decarboxylase subunit alpha [Idiomarina abyssa|tara:strand:+ start:523 stop:2337 length:1815 start_codon:yes stop_codon:yes gene_type:complete